jgi:DNA polymerase-3 subunit gamma/tau
MTYQALARKYRPQSFRDIIGQETVVRTLQNAIEQRRIHHAFLFSGVRGVGKTTGARILAKALNCVKGPAAEPCNECVMCREITEGIDLDVREIDAATYTGVDNIRELRDVTQFQPARDRYRIFIIDEAHMLTTGAWNALLKMIEEPPPHVLFMFATTEIQKVPATILSRVQKFMLRKITLDEMAARLEEICRAEGIEADRGALEIIARRGEGSMRDALSLLDQIIAFSGRPITVVDVATVLGLSDLNFFARMIGLIADGDHAGILTMLEEAAASGRDFKLLYRDFLGFVRNLLLLAGGSDRAAIGMSGDDLEVLESAAGRFSYSELLRLANLLLRDDEIVKSAEHQRLAVEIAFLKAATFPRLQSVERALAGGGASPASEPRRTVTSSRSAAVPTPRRVMESAPPEREQSTPDSAGTSGKDTPAGDPEARGERTRAAAAGEPLGDFVERVSSRRRLLGSYLEQARVRRRDGAVLLFEFDESDRFIVDSLNEAAPSLDEIAAEVYGEGVRVKAAVAVETPVAGRRGEDHKPALSDDPVIKAFQKHLGVEVAPPRKRKENP